MQKEMNKRPVFLTLLICVFFVLVNIFNTTIITLNNFYISLDMILIPFIFFLQILILQKYSGKSLILGIFIALIIQIIIYIGAIFLTDSNITNYEIIANIVSFGVVSAILIILFKTLITDKKTNYLKYLLIYFIIIIIHYLIATIILNNGIPMDFFILIVLDNFIKLLLAVILSFIHLKIER